MLVSNLNSGLMADQHTALHMKIINGIGQDVKHLRIVFHNCFHHNEIFIAVVWSQTVETKRKEVRALRFTWMLSVAYLIQEESDDREDEEGAEDDPLHDGPVEVKDWGRRGSRSWSWFGHGWSLKQDELYSFKGEWLDNSFEDMQPISLSYKCQRANQTTSLDGWFSKARLDLDQTLMLTMTNRRHFRS